MKYFPLFTNLEGRNVLICGGGIHAAEKISRLKLFGAVIKVVSPNLSEDIKNLDGIEVSEHCFTEHDIAFRPIFVVAAENKSENKRIAAICRSSHILVNAVDQPSECDFIFPSVFSTDMLCIGVSTGGASPTAGMVLRDMIGDTVPDRIDDILSWLVDTRIKIREKTDDKEAQKEMLRSAVKLSFSLGRPLSHTELNMIKVT